ncbi:MAG TPA: tetratricopeptide repeat protein [Blastocatellia bacterium]|nr:tetratricopeptide repeat protein [Blastocatellia bacterium]
MQSSSGLPSRPPNRIWRIPALIAGLALISGVANRLGEGAVSDPGALSQIWVWLIFLVALLIAIGNVIGNRREAGGAPAGSPNSGRPHPQNQASSSRSGDDRAESGRATAGRVFNLSNPHDPCFTGREAALRLLLEGFSTGVRVQSLAGLGGMGKTQTALAYIDRYRQHYRVVLWGQARSRGGLISDFGAMAGQLNLRERGLENQSLAVEAVMRWLETHSGWLLVLDDAEDLALAREFIPSKGIGQILLTTQAPAVKEFSECQVLTAMPVLEGALFLLRRLNKIAINAALETAPVALRAAAEALSEAVQGVPLALELAAAFIRERRSTPTEYLELYRAEAAESGRLRGGRARQPDGPSGSVIAACSLTIKRMATESPEAVELLRACCFLEPEAIPEEIFSGGASELGDVLSRAAASGRLLGAIGEAGRFSLLRRDQEQRTLSLHRSVTEVLKDGMDRQTRRLWAGRAVRAVNLVFPAPEYVNWPVCDRLIRQALALAVVIDQFALNFSEAAVLLDRAGEYLYQRGRYAEAEALYHRALAIHEQAHGPAHPFTATSLDHLAELYYSQGKSEEAEGLYQRALAIYERAFGPAHPSTAGGLNHLAMLYYSRGAYAAAEPLYRRALEIFEKALGPDHPNTAMSLNNLAGLYESQGRSNEAEPLYKRALKICEKTLGPHHPSTATNLNHLALLYDSQEKYGEAEPLYQRALAITERAYGSDHPDVALRLNNLARLYESQGRYVLAEPLYQRALEIRERAFGPFHLSTASILESQALLLRKLGRWSQAEKAETRARNIRTGHDRL